MTRAGVTHALAIWILTSCGGAPFATGSARDGGASGDDGPSAEATAGDDSGGGDDGGSSGDGASVSDGGSTVDGSGTLEAAPSNEGGATADGGSVEGGPTGPFTVGGTASGLVASDVMTLEDDGTDTLPVSSNGSFTFLKALPHGASYDVTVLQGPAGRTCDVTNGTGVIAYSNVTNVVVTCH